MEIERLLLALRWLDQAVNIIQEEILNETTQGLTEEVSTAVHENGIADSLEERGTAATTRRDTDVNDRED